MRLKSSIPFSIMLPILLVTVIVSLVAAPVASAQTADEVVAKYVAALGGKEKLQSIHSVYQEGTSVMQNGTEINTKIWKVQDKLYRQDISFGMGNVVIIATPKQGWASNPGNNGGAFTAMSDEQLKALQSQMDCAGPLVDYAAKGNKIELLGKDTVNGSTCYKIKLTQASGNYITYSIDEKTSYVLRETRKGGGFGGGGRRAGGGNGAAPAPDAEFHVDYSDYQKTPDGYIFPFVITIGGRGARNNVEKLEVNKPVDEAALSKPTK